MIKHSLKKILAIIPLVVGMPAIAADNTSPSWTQRAISHVKKVWQEAQSDVNLPLHATINAPTTLSF